MVETNQMVPIKYEGRINIIRECAKFYFKEMWIQNIDQNLKYGYMEMSEINLSLSEMGIAQDFTDLCNYESMLIGREKL